MKAEINGITIDGTPAEIAEYQRLMEERAHQQALQGLMGGSTMTVPWWKFVQVGY